MLHPKERYGQLFLSIIQWKSHGLNVRNRNLDRTEKNDSFKSLGYSPQDNGIDQAKGFQIDFGESMKHLRQMRFCLHINGNFLFGTFLHKQF